MKKQTPILAQLWSFSNSHFIKEALGDVAFWVGVNPFMPTVPTFAVRETEVSRHNGGTSGAPLNPLETIVLSEHYRL